MCPLTSVSMRTGAGRSVPCANSGEALRSVISSVPSGVFMGAIQGKGAGLFRGQFPAHDFQVRLGVGATVGIRGDERAILDRQFVAIDADERPDFAGAGLPEPGLAAEKAVLALEVLGLALAGLVPGLAVVLGAPREVRAIAAVVVHAEEQRTVGKLENIAC